ncbi:MAG TPA: ABC transporter permease [Sphingomonas sp.]
MTHVWRVAWTIARRDYVASVFSRLFLFFMLLPLVFGLIGGMLGAIGKASGPDQDGGPAPVVAVAGDHAFFEALSVSRTRLLGKVRGLYLPPLVARGEGGLPAGAVAAVASGGLDRPRLLVSADAPDELAGQVALIVEAARAARILGTAALPAVEIVRVAAPATRAADKQHDDRVGLARSAQYAVLALTVMLAGRLLSSFVEERSNKVIEVLAAVAPVDAIFLGKLIGMLLFSFTCIFVWGGLMLAGGLLLAPRMIMDLPVPAIGWPLFAPLVLLYFASSFLLLGAVMLGIGAQASSPADIQTLALPTTLAQIMLFGFASVDVARPDHWVGRAAAIFPWSSSLAMIPRAAELPALWPHPLALVWQAAWLALAIRYAARRFRVAVLKSGGGKRGAR